METKTRNTMVGAGVGAAAGAGAGTYVGIKKAAQILTEASQTKKLAESVDAYVSSRQNVAFEKLDIANMSKQRIEKAMKKVAEKAKEDFPKVCEGLKEKAVQLSKKAKLTKISA